MYNERLENIKPIDKELIEKNNLKTSEITIKGFCKIGNEFIDYLVNELENLKNLINDPNELEILFNGLSFRRFSIGYLGKDNYVKILFDPIQNNFYFIQNENKVYLHKNLSYLNFYKGFCKDKEIIRNFKNFKECIEKDKHKLTVKINQTKENYLYNLNYVLKELN